MLKKLQKPNSEGFTNNEVMIVLALAALILLIVLLAVPALQRNSRNTTLKNDASTVAGAINTFESDNNGKVPTSITGTGTVKISIASGNSENASVQGSTKVSTIAAQPTKAINNGEIQVYIGKTCPTALGGSGQSNTRAFSIFYSTETSGDSTLQCVDS